MNTENINYNSYVGNIWVHENKVIHPELLELLALKDCLIVLKHGIPPYNVIFGVPHQAVIGEKIICENRKSRDSDENAASYALVAFSLLKNHDIPCKLVIMAHSTTADPNKDLSSPYCQEVFKEPAELILECHGAGSHRKLDIELSSGRNSLAATISFGEHLALALGHLYTLGAQKQPDTCDALIFQKDRTRIDGSLELPANATLSLVKAQEMGIRALHLEAKPQFRKSEDGSNAVSDDGYNLGYALAQTIVIDWIQQELEKVEQICTDQSS